MAEVTAYCMKCRTTRTMEEPQETTMKNGRPAVKGKCGVCGTGLFKIVKKPQAA